MLNLNFSKKGLELVFPPHFVHDSSRKMFLELHSINWPNFIVWLLLPRQILGNMFIAIICYAGYDVTKVEINFIFLIKPLCYMTNRSRQKLKYVENEKSFWGKVKAFFIIFKVLSSAKNCLRTESAP